MAKKKEKQLTILPTKEMMAKSFIGKVQEAYVNRYADATIGILEDKKRLEKALKFVNETLKKVESGEFDAIDDYVKRRKSLEYSDYGGF